MSWNYEPTVLHHDQNRKCGKGKSELGLELAAAILKRDMDRGWRHFWSQPHRKGMEPPESSWRVSNMSFYQNNLSGPDKVAHHQPSGEGTTTQRAKRWYSGELKRSSDAARSTSLAA